MCNFLQQAQQKYFLLPCYTTVWKTSYSVPENGFFFSSMIDHFIKQQNCVTLPADQRTYHHVAKLECLNFLLTTWSSMQDFVLLKAVSTPAGDPSAPPVSHCSVLLPLLAAQHLPWCSSSLTTHSCRLAFRWEREASASSYSCAAILDGKSPLAEQRLVQRTGRTMETSTCRGTT